MYTSLKTIIKMKLLIKTIQYNEIQIEYEKIFLTNVENLVSHLNTMYFWMNYQMVIILSKEKYPKCSIQLLNLLDEIFPSFNLARISLCKICTCKREYVSSSIISGNWIVEIKWSRRTLQKKKEKIFFSEKKSYVISRILFLIEIIK
jgi:hypothetical protein